MTTARERFQDDMHKRPEELQREADDVRADVEHTVEELMNQFSPGELLNQAIARLRSGGDNAFVHNLATQIQNNPVPAVLTGAGLVWLMSASKQPPARAAYGAGEGARERLGAAAGHARASAQGMKEQARDRQHRMAAGAADLKARASETGHQAMERARTGARSARDNYQQMLSEQPLVVGALAIAAGAALGAMFPRTRGEDRAMGDISDRQSQALQEKAEGVAEQAEHKVQDKLHQHPGDIGTGAAGGAAEPDRESSSSASLAQEPRATSSPSSSYTPPAGASGHPGSLQGGTAGYEPPSQPRDTGSSPTPSGVTSPRADRPHHRP